MKSWLCIAPRWRARSHSGGAAAPTRRARFTPTDLNRLARISDPQVSPDGRYVVYVQRETDLEANRGRTDLWLRRPRTPRRRSRGGSRSTRPTTRIRAGRRTAPASISCPRAPARTQIWRLPLPGGEAVQITDYPLDVGTFEFSPTAASASRSAMDVFPDCADLKCTRERLDAAAQEQDIGAHLRQPVRAPLGHLERSARARTCSWRR